MRQNAFCERQDAFYVDFVDRLGVPVDLGERQVLTSSGPGRTSKGRRVEPTCIEPLSIEDLRTGLDTQVARAQSLLAGSDRVEARPSIA